MYAIRSYYVLDRDLGDNRRAQHDDDALAHQGRKNPLERRWQHHPGKDLQPGQPQGEAGLPLPLGCGGNAGTQDLRAVGPQVHHHGQQPRLPGTEFYPHGRQAEEDDRITSYNVCYTKLLRQSHS